MSKQRTPLRIPIKPWFQDHCFGGRVILPAVETMLLLSAQVMKVYPDVDVRVMENGSFPKFLEIPSGTTELDVLIECGADDTGRVVARLQSRIQFKSMSRIKEHGEIFFQPSNTNLFSSSCIDSAQPANSVREIDREKIYRDLVPFGPSYQTLQENLCLGDLAAWGKVKAPELPADPIQEKLGSPFPLDGALHAACVLGQQSVDFVPFPIGFKRRVVTRPTQPGSEYNIRITQISGTDEELGFDLLIFDGDGEIFETISGVRMRDVSGTVRN